MTDALTVAIFHEEVKEFVKRTKNSGKCTTIVGTTVGSGIRCGAHQIGGTTGSRGHAPTECRGGLLNAIKDLMCNIQELKYIPLAIHLA